MRLPPDSESNSADLPLEALRTTENFLIACLRLWSHRHVSDSPTSADWRSGFKAVGRGKLKLTSTAQKN